MMTHAKNHKKRNDRYSLQKLLEDLLGSKNVYFQPPEGFKMQYPCIIYQKSDEYYRHADNIRYHERTVYDVTVIDCDPDSKIPHKVSKLNYCRFNRCFVSGNMYHNVYELTY